MRKGEAKRRAILDVAEKLFYSKGYEATSVQDVLDVLAVSKGCFYHHFDSKEQVLDTLCRERAAKSAAACEQQLSALTDPLARLQCVFYCLMPLRKGEERFLRVMLPMLLHPEGQAMRLSFQDALERSFAPLLAREVETGRAAGVVCSLDNAELPGLLCDLAGRMWLRAAQRCLGFHELQQPMDAAALLELLEMYRFALERLLDIPFGTIEVLRVDELMAALGPVLKDLNMPMRM